MREAKKCFPCQTEYVGLLNNLNDSVQLLYMVNLSVSLCFYSIKVQVYVTAGWENLINGIVATPNSKADV